ncbi:MAG: hypothetical protein NC310_00960 [Roseburia sp.]|nr:hypothetical protein [Anaeroplasma bactoclasticum]MCM1195623.1 hypothetical protein [Roseburia sp.]MCM1556632.1 hypothetical protein [Anaeroplasma bactoclasticum]
MDMIKFLITWGPTFLFLIIVLFGILVGFIRGFRKSLILFIQMLAAGIICLIVYLCILNNPNLDSNMVGFLNGILGKFGTSLQRMLSVNDNCTTLHAMLIQAITSNMSADELPYLLITENAAYINTIVDMAYHLFIALFCFILYFIIVFFLYLIYLIAYPVRRKIRKENRKFQNGEINHPYKRKRLLGGLVGGVRSFLTAVICFSFLGSLIFVITGGTQLPQRDQIKEEGTVEFENQTWNEAYDYYSYVCAMGNTGIFKMLNSLKDTGNTPFYFYFADIVLQGRIYDENLNIENEKFYLRDEMGEYVHFINTTLGLIMKYGNLEDIEDLINNQAGDRQMQILISTMGNEEFAEEFSKLIDEFEGKPFMTNLCLSSLTSLVNHIDFVSKDEKVIGLVNQLFKSEDAIQVTDLATEADVKNLFKGLVQVIVEVNESQNISSFQAVSGEEENIESTKQMILIAKNFIPTIQNLSLFNERSDIGNKIIKGLYTYASTSLISDEKIEFDVPNDIVWIDEFNILLNACDPLLSIAYEIYNKDSNIMIENFAYIFEGDTSLEMEEAFDTLALQLESSLLLDVVFKSSLVGEQIDKIVIGIAKDENAKIPKDIDYVGADGECSVLMTTLKLLLKNGGGPLLLTMMQDSGEIKTEQIKEMIGLFTKEITIDGKTTSMIKNIINSKLIYYMLSTFLIYADFGSGGFKLYLPAQSVEEIEGCKVIKHSEIEVIADLLSNCVNLIIEVIDNPTNIDYAHIFSNDYIKNTVNESLLLQGTLANVIIGVSASQDKIVLPITYDDPESWIDTSGKGEICILLDAIFSIAEITVEGGTYLINELLNGNIQPSVLLNLEKGILNQLCSSLVLRYTISDMITNLGSSGFEIVVARASLEKVNALTTTEKVVNVIQAEELSEIFIDIQQILSFSENGEIKINYNAIFKNKSALSENKTITATLIQALLNNGADFLVIPNSYKIDFEKFKTDLDLSGNIWFGTSNTVEDDEIYLMLCAIETFIDKDSNGDIPSDFDFNTIQDNLKLREDGIDDICASAILNATISKQIIDIFQVPSELYQNEIVIRSELDALFGAVFKLFNKNEIVVKELDSDLFDLSFRQSTISAIVASTIFRATITNKMENVNMLYVPLTDTIESEFVGKEAGYIINQTELTNVFNALFKILNSDTIMVNDFEQQLTELEIKKDAIDSIAKSHILNATISAKLSETSQIIILEKDAPKEQMLNEESVYNITEPELTKLLNAMFTIVQKDSIIVGNISNELSNLSISKNDVNLLLDSKIVSATISHKIIDTNGLSIPKFLTTEELSTQNKVEHLIQQNELNNLLVAMFVVLDQDKLELLNLNSNLENIELTDLKVNSILKSEILQLAISEKFITVDDLVIPRVVIKEVLTLQNEIKEKIDANELSSFFDALFSTTDGSISTNGFGLHNLCLPTTLIDANIMTKSIIVSATLSSKIMAEDSVLCVIDEMNTTYEYQGLTTSEKYINQEELSNLLIALTVGMGLNDSTNLSLNDISVPIEETQKEALINSEIIRAMISQKVLDQEGVGIASTSTHLDRSRHYHTERVGILSKTEIRNIITGIQLLNPDNGSFDNLVLDVGQILKMANKEIVLKTISDSDVYTYIISRTLGKNQTGEIKGYQLFTTSFNTAIIENVEYTYQASKLLPGIFNINYPTTVTNIFTSFHLANDSDFVLKAIDILALQNTIQSSLSF